MKTIKFNYDIGDKIKLLENRVDYWDDGTKKNVWVLDKEIELKKDG
ncbi:MAG: hypothetical protein ABH835_04535 [Patescibacteria group bacterium]